MTAFFVPEIDRNGESDEAVYAGLRRAALARTGHEPMAERIFKLWWRRGGVDCEAEVGKPDPVSGKTVLAILDLGRQGPYVVECGSPGGPITEVVVEKPVYAATAFTVPAGPASG